jgi:hypothetical protein
MISLQRWMNEFGEGKSRARRPVIGHVLLRGHARNSERFSRAGGAADRAIVTASALKEQ